MNSDLFNYLLLVFLLLLSAFFSCSETSFTAASKSRIYKMKSDGSKVAARLLKLLESRDKLISFILLGNNATNIFASSIATVIAVNYFADKPAFAEHAFQISSLILTLVVLIFAEIFPKTIAMNYSEFIALIFTDIYLVLIKIFGPIISTLNLSIVFLMRMVGIRTKASYEESFSAQDTIRGEIEYFHSKGSFVKNDKDMLGGVLDLVDMNVESVMTHRKAVDMVDIDDDIAVITEFIKDSEHTRIPVFKDKEENIIGILHLRDLFVLLSNKKDVTSNDLKQILFEPLFVSNKTKLKTQLLEFKKRRSHMAVVIDEYGGVMGIITLEDIIEEIVGDIEDEHDEFERCVFTESPGVMVVSGECFIRDFNKEIGSSLPYDGVSTMAGLVIRKAEKIPDENEEFVIADYRITVLTKESNKVTYLRVEKLNSIGDDSGDDGALPVLE